MLVRVPRFSQSVATALDGALRTHSGKCTTVAISFHLGSSVVVPTAADEVDWERQVVLSSMTGDEKIVWALVRHCVLQDIDFVRGGQTCNGTDTHTDHLNTVWPGDVCAFLTPVSTEVQIGLEANHGVVGVYVQRFWRSRRIGRPSVIMLFEINRRRNVARLLQS